MQHEPTDASWFVPDASSFRVQRASLNLGLRAADSWYRERVTPGVGGATFVRGFSWAAAALLLRDLGTRARAVDIARGIEALACKAQYQEGDTTRVIGTRAFARDPEAILWTYSDLRKPSNYVRNTFRQIFSRPMIAATSNDRSGLGLATGTRFDGYVLTPPGQDLAEAFLDATSIGQGSPSTGTWLAKWVAGTSLTWSWHSLHQALSPTTPTKAERRLLLQRLTGTADRGGIRRRALADLMGDAKTLPDIDRELVPQLKDREHARDIQCARRFGTMLDAGLEAIAALQRLLTEGPTRLERTARDSSVTETLTDLHKSCLAYVSLSERLGHGHKDALAFARLCTTVKGARLVKTLADRSSGVVSAVDGVLRRGPLYRPAEDDASAPDSVDEAVEVVSTDQGRTFRLFQLHSLLRDCSA